MNIKIVSTAYPLRGGIANFNGLLYKYLSKEHDVEVYTFKRQYPKLLFPGKSQLEEKEEAEKIPTQVLVDSINPFNWVKIGFKLMKSKPDLLIYKYWMPFFGPCLGTINRIAKKNKITKSLVICDNVIPHEKKPGDKIFTKYFFYSVDYFITMSEFVEKDLKSIIPNANSFNLFHPVYSNFGENVDKEVAKAKLKIHTEKVLLFFGFIRKYKGLDTLLEAINLIKENEDITLIVAGEFYIDKEPFYNFVNDNGLDGRVKFFSDYIPSDEVKYYFSAADVVILPYKKSTQSGITQIANHFNVPMIATRTGGLGEVVKDNFNGYLIEPDNPEMLAKTIVRFYSEGKKDIFSENIKGDQEKYSWNSFVNKLISFVKN